MKKNLFATALACALSLAGLALFAEDEKTSDATFGHAYAEKSKIQFNGQDKSFTSSKGGMRIAFAAKDDKLLNNLKTLAEQNDGKQFGFMVDGNFVSLQSALETAEDTTASNDGEAIVRLRKFSARNLQFGLQGETFEPFSGPTNTVTSDPFYGGYNVDSFYSVDFAENPFDGMIDILVMGEPLPAPVVTLLVALAAGAAFLLFKNRKQRAFRIEQA